MKLIQKLSFACLTAGLLVFTSLAAFAEGTLRIGRDSDSNTMDAIKTTQNVDIWVINNVHAFLVRSNREGNDIEPDLAESWTVSDDNLAYTFKIRDAKFSDGTSVTLDDVVFSLERLRDHPESTQSSLFQVMERIEAADDHTLVITLAEPSAAFLSTLAMYASSIVPKAAVESMGDDFGTSPVSAGRFKVAQWRRGEVLVLEPNEHYYGSEGSQVDRVEFQVVPDDNTRMLKVQAGELDVAMGLPFSMLPQLEADSNVQVHLDPSTREDHLLLNHTNEVLAIKEVRQAINMGINMDAIIQVVNFGIGEPANSLIPAGTLYHNPDNMNWPYDPEKAKAMIEAAGATGATLQYVISAGSASGEQQGIVVQQQLAQIGLSIELKKVDPGQVWTAFVDGEYDIAPAYWTYDILDPDQKVAFSVGADDNQSYFTRYENPQVTQLVTDARLELDPAKRQDLYNQIQAIVKEEVHWVDLYYSPFSNVSTSSVKGFYQNPMGVIPLHEISVE